MAADGTVAVKTAKTTPTTSTTPAGAGAAPRGARAAAALLALGPEAAAEVLRLLPQSAVAKLARSAHVLESAPSSAVDDVAREFVSAMEGYATGAETRGIALREIMERALGEDGVRRALAPPPTPEDKRMQPLVDVEAGNLALLLEAEQAPTVALVLSLLPAAKAAAVLAKMPEQARGAVLRGVFSLSSVSPDVVDDVVAGLTDQVQRFVKNGKRRTVDGTQAAVSILRLLAPDMQRAAVDDIERGDAALAETIRGKLIAFEDIGDLSRKEIQLFLQTCDARTLALALKGAPESLVEKMLANMSQRAGAALREEIEMIGRARLSQVEAAQADLIKVVLHLAEEGKVNLLGSSEKMV